MRRFGRVVLGGTFDRLHIGHEVLLTAALRSGRSVAIGVTTERYLAGHPKPGGRRVQSYATRRRALRRWLAGAVPTRRWTIVPIDDAFGGSVEDGVDALVVSADTVAGGRAVNAERRRRGRRSIPVVVVPLVLADDLRPVSSRRIRAGEIDRSGRRTSRIEVGLATDMPSDWVLAARGIRLAFPAARVVHDRIEARRSSRGPRRRPTPVKASTPRELGVVVRRDPGGTRRILVQSRELRLEPLTMRSSSASGLSTTLARLLRRSTAAKRFSHPRR